VPLKRELPPFVTALMLMPPEPYSAAKLELWTFTSWTMSLFSVTMTPLFDPMSISAEPSRLTVLFDERMPLTV
jgi:hypothetical protein